ncbi:helix-turn-helix domain-containing protein [Phenylobacterium soli]|uniref:Uncharacterized protein n=1 Tax=Phenylobacterium soli TaxID=2170551 RepID=A0A328AP33_9CAUL|nr:hypothetical protein [Phenylobacterium soli]RAK56125.1 hypothetical protein DJ017_17200 [Phenylobacterium soli]
MLRALTSADEADGLDDATELSPVLMLDALLVILDLLHRSPCGAPVSARTVLMRKGYRRWGNERRAFERRVNAQLIGLDGLVRRLAGDGEPLLAFAPRNVARTDFMVRPGGALVAELAAPDCVELGAAVLRFDHRKNRGADALAKKLAVALAHSPESEVLRVRDILAATGEWSRYDNGGRCDRLAARFEAALGLLRAAGLCRLELEPPCERPYGWFRTWCGTEVRVTSWPRPVPLPRTDGTPSPRGRALTGRRGRPPFSPTADQRALVAALSADGCSRTLIAGRVGVSLPTLRRYFAVELAAAERRAAGPLEARGRSGGDFLQIFDALLRSARAGAGAVPAGSQP